MSVHRLMVSVLVAFPLLATTLEAAAQGHRLQSWRCTGIVKTIEIFVLAETTASRRVKTTFSDGSVEDETYKIETTASRTSYIDPDRGEFMRYINGRLEFWEESERIPDDVYTMCKVG